MCFLHIVYWFNCISVIALRSCFSNNWYQSQKVYLVCKLARKKGSWFKWKQWWKKESLGSRNLMDKTISYGRCKWRTICTCRWVEKQNSRRLWRNEKWEVLDKKALWTIRLCLASSVAFNISKEKNNRGCDERIVETLRKTLGFQQGIFNQAFI